MVYVRHIADTTLTLIVSGKLWRNSLIMQDNETGSLWSHVTGEALDGPMKGQYLEAIPSVQTTWAEWVGEHPRTLVLRKEHEVLSSRYEKYFRDPDRAGTFNVEWLRGRLPGKSIVYGVVRGPFAAAVAEGRLASDPLVNIEVGEDPVVVFRADDGGVRAYVSQVDSVMLHFEWVADSLDFVDDETGSTWDLVRGVSMSGELKGSELEEIKVLPAFWFAWSSFYPKTDVVD